MNIVPVTLRRLGITALLALLGWAHAPVLALDLPGAAPQAAAVLPEYEPQRLNAIFVSNKDSRMASQWVRRDKLDSQLAALRVHAGNPTLHFNNADQQAQARRDAILLAATMAQVTAPPETTFELLLRAAIALSIAHNLGAPEAATLADARFERLLQKVPELPAGLLEYGIHLTNTNRPTEALVPLRRALTQGNDEARWPLAMSLAALGQRTDAVAELEALQARSPTASTRYPLAATLTALRAAPG